MPSVGTLGQGGVTATDRTKYIQGIVWRRERKGDYELTWGRPSVAGKLGTRRKGRTAIARFSSEFMGDSLRDDVYFLFLLLGTAPAYIMTI